MEKIYVCRQCGFTIREMELADWTKHDFVNQDKVSPREIPDYDKTNNCENYEILEEYAS